MESVRRHVKRILRHWNSTLRVNLYSDSLMDEWVCLMPTSSAQYRDGDRIMQRYFISCFQETES